MCRAAQNNSGSTGSRPSINENMWLSSITNFEDDHHWRRTLACIKLDPTVAGDNALARDGGRPDVTGPALATGALTALHYTQSVTPTTDCRTAITASNKGNLGSKAAAHVHSCKQFVICVQCSAWRMVRCHALAFQCWLRGMTSKQECHACAILHN